MSQFTRRDRPWGVPSAVGAGVTAAGAGPALEVILGVGSRSGRPLTIEP